MSLSKREKNEGMREKGFGEKTRELVKRFNSRGGRRASERET